MSVPELDPQIIEVLRKEAESGTRRSRPRRPRRRARTSPAARKEQFGEVDEMHAVEDRDADGVPIRIYRPVETTEPSTALVYFHGGGWVVGSIDTHDGITRALAKRAGCVVISVDYRLAPEHPYPGCARRRVDGRALGARARGRARARRGADRRRRRQRRRQRSRRSSRARAVTRDAVRRTAPALPGDVDPRRHARPTRCSRAATA